MSDNASQSGGRRGIIVAVATALFAVAGVVLIAAGFLGGPDGPPDPPASASMHESRQPESQPSRSAPAESASESAPSQPADTGSGDAGEKPANSTGRSGSDAAPDAVRTLDRSSPVALRVPAIDVRTSRTVPLGIQPSGKIEVPKGNWTVGWYKQGPTPGQFGPALMGAHVDSDRGPALFYGLGELRPGDKAMVRRADGKTAVFTVYSVEQYPKNRFPTQRVYAPTENRAELRLITCGGTFDEDVQHYRDNIVVYAKMTDVR